MGNTFQKCKSCGRDDETFEGPSVLRDRYSIIDNKPLRSSGSFSSTTSQQSSESARSLSDDRLSSVTQISNRSEQPSPSFNEANGLDTDYHLSEFLRNSGKDEISPRATALNAERARAESLGLLPLRAEPILPLLGMVPAARIPVTECLDELRAVTKANVRHMSETVPCLDTQSGSLPNQKSYQDDILFSGSHNVPVVVNQQQDTPLNEACASNLAHGVVKGTRKPVKRNLKSGLGRALQVYQDSMGTLEINPDAPLPGMRRCPAHRRALSELAEIDDLKSLQDEASARGSRPRTETDHGPRRKLQHHQYVAADRIPNITHGSNENETWRSLLEADDEEKFGASALRTPSYSCERDSSNSLEYVLSPRKVKPYNWKQLSPDTTSTPSKALAPTTNRPGHNRHGSLLSLVLEMGNGPNSSCEAPDMIPSESLIATAASSKEETCRSGSTQGGFGYFIERTPPSVVSSGFDRSS